MKKKTLYALEVPAVTNEFAQTLDKVFPKLEMKPGISTDKAMYNAGERRVVEWVLNAASGNVISGDPDKLKREDKPSLLSKIVDSIKSIT